MRLLSATPLRVRHPTRKRCWIIVPGGWPMRVPEIERVSDAPKDLAQALLDSAYVKALREALARRARQYAILYPELAEPYGRETSKGSFVKLLGFLPEELQWGFIPFHGSGREAHAAIVASLDAMAAKEKARSARSAA